METLAQIYERHKAAGSWTDKGDIHSYLEVYEELFRPYQETAKRVLEIGVFKGDSLRLFEEYFVNAEVHGIDCSDQPHGGMADLRPMIQSRMHHIHIGDATDVEFAEWKFPRTEWDIIIDDAAHNIEQQMRLIDVWRPRLASGGCYVVEDVQEVDSTRGLFEARGYRIEDRRLVRPRYDDVIAIFGGK